MLPVGPTPENGIRFSIVVAAYNVAPYLPDFIKSIESQSFDLEQVEVILVDDGSTDESPRVLQDWQNRRPDLVTVMSKENGGQSSARNLGLTIASGEWVTFPDPDDMLDKDYLFEVAQFLVRHPETEMVGTNRLMVMDITGTVVDQHPLKKPIRARDDLVDLDLLPTLFFGSVSAAFFKLERIRELKLEFDERTFPGFEDGHFCVNYLLDSPSSAVALLQSAKYIYRKRADLSSITQTSGSFPSRFTNVLEFGYIDVLRKAHGKHGHVPLWLQNYILYELYWYLKTEDAHANSISAATGPVADRFHELMPQILEYIDPGVISSSKVKPFKQVWRDVLNHSWSTTPWHSPYAVLSKYDEADKLARLTYRYVGPPPREQFFIGVDPIEPNFAKHRSIHMFDRTVIHERIAWVPTDGPLSLRLDGELTDFRYDWPPATTAYMRRDRLRGLIPKQRSRLGKTKKTKAPIPKERKRAAKAKSKFLRQASSNRKTRRFQDAWVLIDRVADADDNAEHVFRYLRSERPDINAWFAIAPDTPDWNRLQADGYGKRMVAYGSDTWKLLMANCQVLISSHADVAIMKPPEITSLIKPGWRSVFLQHGVTQADISNWLNPKDFDLFVTSTPNEQASIIGDDTGYKYTAKEAKLTEFPRFDRLLEKGREYPPEKRDLIVLAPTWRNWLLQPLKPGSYRREVIAGFTETEYWGNWLGLLASEQLVEAAARKHLQIAFLPHPNLRTILADIQLPEYVVPLSFEGQDIRSHFARAAVFITDYSSTGFDAAYIERPIVYFQFDQEKVFSGAHLGRKGYFDYDEQGFGPVTKDLNSAVDATVRTIEDGPEPTPYYLERIQATFPYRDGNARQRVTNEIEALFNPPSREPTPTPTPVPTPVTGQLG